MSEFGIRWTNFRAFEDTGSLTIKPLTIILGSNASGKTSLIAPLLILKQTFEAWDPTNSLKTKGGLFNAGFYNDLILHHKKDLPLCLELRLGPMQNGAPGPKIPLGNSRPAKLKLGYKYSSPGESPILQTYSVEDEFGRSLLTRNNIKSRQYNVESFLNLPPTSEATQAIYRSKPQGFLFTPDSVFNELFKVRMKQTSRSTTSKKERSFKFDESHQLYLDIVSFVGESMRSLLHNMAYIGPLRAKSKRTYELGGEKPYSVGPSGGYTAEILFRNREKDLQKQVNEWIQRFDFGKKLECKRLAEGIFNVSLQHKSSSTKINIADTGFGLSQVLPLIVQGHYARKGSTIIAEQPEIHLNPKLQAVLADLFVSVANRGVNLVIETHSEHLLLRLRRLVAEKRIKHDDIAIYFTERKNNQSTVREIPIDASGHIENDQWPRGFFEENLKEALALASSQMEIN